MHETVYEERFGFTNALKQMGADIVVMRDCIGSEFCRFHGKSFGHSAIISGSTPLKAADIEVPDLRGGFSHIIAALTAEGTSHVTGVEIIARSVTKNFKELISLRGRLKCG